MDRRRFLRANSAGGASAAASVMVAAGAWPGAYVLSDEGRSPDLWFGGHTHTNPDDDKGGRTHAERKWGVNFINCAALSRYHAAKTTLPMSRLLTFNDGLDAVRVQCYLHTA
jgi:hypothetical protein